jgi:hypothetical protein
MIDKYTFLTVNGLSIESGFSIDVTIKIAGGVLGTTEENKSFPFIVRS